ncbi:flagellar assembly protein FliX [Falsiroseomonas sp. HW251]|uniref:flagellar assembly protein FliX n=1 Tax=Falsiroseomonas sp. HW251 TaxID=3390998 RepID=UPI003D315CA7
MAQEVLVVVRVGSVGRGMPPRRAGRAGGGFSLPAGREAAGPSVAAGAGAVGALLGLPDATPPEPPEARAGRRAHSTLEELRGLQLDLLRGGNDLARLERLAALAESEDIPLDPGLREAVAGVALRARIELARRRRAVA